VIAPSSTRNGRFFVTAIRSTVLLSVVALLLVLGGALHRGHTAGWAGSEKFDRATPFRVNEPY
jgi:hypothetical protein